MMIMGFEGLGDLTVQYYNVDNLPACSTVDEGIPCRTADGSVIFVLIPCSQQTPGQPCYALVQQQGPTATTAPSGTSVESAQGDPFLTAQAKAQAAADAAARQQAHALKLWGIALAVGAGLGVIGFNLFSKRAA
jgi:hypothetical protein